jgi:hypothetical protein
MMICQRNSNDPLLREMLDRYAINLIVPPRADLLPGDILVGTGGNKVRKGGWTEILAHQPSPEAAKGAAVESLELTTSRAMDSEASASAVGVFLHNLGITTPKMQAALKSTASRSLRLSVEAPSSLTLENVDAILEELRVAGVRPTAAYERAKIFLVTHIYRATGLRLEVAREDSKCASGSAEAAELLAADAQIKVDARRDGGFAFRASDPAVFGVAVRRLDFGPSGLLDREPEAPLKIMGVDQSLLIVGDAIDEGEAVCLLEDGSPNSSFAR